MAKPENSAFSGNSSDDKPWQSYHTVYTNAKAGMEGVDKEKVQRIVYEMSKGSKYFENEERKEAEMKQKIENMRARCAKLTAADLSLYQKIADKRVLELEASRDLSKTWLHVDMDAFYAAVETLSDPSLKGKPMAVGGMSMISTANYEARKFGVRAAMPGFIARKLCPELIFVPVDFKKYNHYSDLTRKVFQRYDPNFLAASLDEAYLDITKVCQERGLNGGEVAEELRSNVCNETGLTCSAGVAPNRLLAKVCSDINKPNGQFILPNNRMAVMTFISSLPIRKIGGIGKVTENILKNALGITTCEEMLQKSSFLCALFSRSSSDFFLSVALGLGGTDTPQISSRKSISNERTFSATSNELFLYQKLADLAETLSADMEKEGLCGKTLTLKLKTASFEVRTRALTLPNYISSSDDIVKHASKLLKAELPVSLRLMGLRMSHFRDETNGILADPTQKTLSSFISSGNSCQQNATTDDTVSFGSEISNDAHSLYIEDHPPLLGSESSGPRDSGGNNHIPDIFHADGDHVHAPNNLDSEGLIETWNYKVAEANHPGMGTGSVTTEGTENVLSKRVTLPEDTEIIPHRLRDSLYEGIEAGSSGSRTESFSWVDNYKCSVCGVELPPSFVEERQEHFDFHLAEKLQDEESGYNYHNPVQKERLTKREGMGDLHKPRKKQKSSVKDVKHVSIDKYFTKMNQNF